MKLISILFLTSAFFNSAFAHPGDFACTPEVMKLGMQAFETALSKGLEATDLNDNKVMLGSDITVAAIEIKDIFKDAYELRFRLMYVNSTVNHSVLKTTIYGVNRSSCTIENAQEQLGNPAYRITSK
jgi:hypothetical protein